MGTVPFFSASKRGKDTMVTRLIAGAVLMAMVWTQGALGAEPPAAPEANSAVEGHGHAAGHQSSEESAAEGLNPITFKGFNFTGDLAIWTGVIFLVVLLILWKSAWGPITLGLQKREEEIAAQIAEALRGNQESQRLLAEYEKKLAAAQDEVRAIIDRARRDAEKVGHDMLDRAKEDAAAERQRALQQIEMAVSAATKELAERSATMAVELAGKILGAQLKPQDHVRLIQEAVASFQGQSNGKK